MAPPSFFVFFGFGFWAAVPLGVPGAFGFAVSWSGGFPPCGGGAVVWPVFAPFLNSMMRGGGIASACAFPSYSSV